MPPSPPAPRSPTSTSSRTWRRRSRAPKPPSPRRSRGGLPRRAASSARPSLEVRIAARADDLRRRRGDGRARGRSRGDRRCRARSRPTPARAASSASRPRSTTSRRWPTSPASCATAPRGSARSASPGRAGRCCSRSTTRCASPGVYELPFGATLPRPHRGPRRRPATAAARCGRSCRRCRAAFLPAAPSTSRSITTSLRAAGLEPRLRRRHAGRRGRRVRGRAVARRSPASSWPSSAASARRAGWRPTPSPRCWRRSRAATAGDYRGQIEKIAAFTARKGHCSLIEMAAAPVLSALRLFPEDFAHHAAHGTCPGGAPSG